MKDGRVQLLSDDDCDLIGDAKIDTFHAVSRESEIRYHPLLPTTAEAQQFPESFDSDHLPCFYNIPLMSEDSDEILVKIISYNILWPNLYSGYFPFQETNESQLHRAERLIRRFKAFNDFHMNDIFCLQECWFVQGQVQAVCQVLGPKWKAIEGSAGKITFINTAKVAVIEALEDHRDNTQKIKFSCKNKEFLLVNVHMPHQNFPMAIEKQVSGYLDINGNVIVVGDFNSRVAPVSLGPTDHSIVTNVVTSQFRESKGQGCDWTDGCFFKNDYENKHYQVARTIVSDPEVWGLESEKKITRKELTTNSLSKFQKNELERHRIFLHIDHALTHCLIDDFASFTQLEALMGHEVMVRWASNAFNERMVAIRLPIEFKEKNAALTALYHGRDGCSVQWIEDGFYNYTVIFVPPEAISNFVLDYHKHFVWKFIGNKSAKVPSHFSIELIQSCNEMNLYLNELHKSVPDDGFSQIMVSLECYAELLLLAEPHQRKNVPDNFKNFITLFLDYARKNAHPLMYKIGIAVCVIGALVAIAGAALLSAAYFPIAAALMAKLAVDAALIAASIPVIATGANVVTAGAAMMFFSQRSPVVTAVENFQQVVNTRFIEKC